jgi:type II secretory pathway pseudopilin PulG
MMFKKKIAGFSILEVMVAAGVGAVAMLLFFSFLTYQSKNIQTQKVISARNAILAQIKAAAANPQAIRNSANSPLNAGLAACLANSASCPVAATEFYLYDPGNGGTLLATPTVVPLAANRIYWPLNPGDTPGATGFPGPCPVGLSGAAATQSLCPFQVTISYFYTP